MILAGERRALESPPEEALFDLVLPRILEQRAAGVSGGEFLELGGKLLYLKYSPMLGKVRRRHGLRWLAGIEPPRLREFDNLAWLRANGFHAPEPLLAGVLGRRHAPTFQYLATRRVDGARTLREVFEEETGALRAVAVDLLASEVARLHHAGFTHRDLFPRNLLLTVADETARLHFLDTWRGGPARTSWSGARGPAYDIACFMVFGLGLLSGSEQTRFVERYLELSGMSAQRGEKFLARAARLRSKLVAHLARRKRVVPPVPPGEWRP